MILVWILFCLNPLCCIVDRNIDETSFVNGMDLISDPSVGTCWVSTLWYLCLSSICYICRLGKRDGGAYSHRSGDTADRSKLSKPNGRNKFDITRISIINLKITAQECRVLWQLKHCSIQIFRDIHTRPWNQKWWIFKLNLHLNFNSL